MNIGRTEKKPPLITIDGERQTGRTTLAQHLQRYYAEDGVGMQILDVGLLYRSVAAQITENDGDTSDLQRAVLNATHEIDWDKSPCFVSPDAPTAKPNFLNCAEIDTLTKQMTTNTNIYAIMQTQTMQLVEELNEAGKGAILIGRGTGDRMGWRADARIACLPKVTELKDIQDFPEGRPVMPYSAISKNASLLAQDGYITVGHEERAENAAETVARNVYEQIKGMQLAKTPFAHGVQADSAALQDTVSASVELNL